MKKIAIFGSREIDTESVTEILNELMVKENWYITSGNIKGAAECARKVAEDKGIKITLYNYESGLGFYIALKDITIKNQKMVAECDEALVFWNGESKGTAREIKMLKKAGKPYRIYNISKSKFNIDELPLREQISIAEVTNDYPTIEHLSNHSDWRVRRSIAANVNTPQDIMDRLSQDISPYVRFKIEEKLKSPITKQ